MENTFNYEIHRKDQVNKDTVRLDLRHDEDGDPTVVTLNEHGQVDLVLFTFLEDGTVYVHDDSNFSEIDEEDTSGGNPLNQVVFSNLNGE
jgi:hypothetical protein